MIVGAIIRGHKTINGLVSSFYYSFQQVNRNTGQPQEMHNDNAAQGAEMTRRQHKRGSISKQYKRREMRREMLSKVFYKSDTMHNQLHTIESNKSDSSDRTSAH